MLAGKEGQHMKFYIPVNRVEELEKIIARYRNKGASISYCKGEESVQTGTLTIEDPVNHVATTKPIMVRCVEVDVEGYYIIEGWKFVGVIEFTDNGNIIRLADSSFEGKVPEKYRHTPMICEHCNTIRNRKDTYLIFNEKTGEFKQVGRNCLMEYTNGLDAERCAAIMSCLDKCINLGDREFGFDEFCSYRSSGLGEDSFTVEKYAITLVKEEGYNGSATVGTLTNFLFPTNANAKKIEPASKEEVEEISKWARTLVNSNNDYLRNASLTWLKECTEYRDYGLICSFVAAYYREAAKIELQKAKVASKSNEHIGKIGERITICVKSARVLFTKYSDYGDSYFIEIIDENGHTIVWSTCNNEIEAGDKITATVKDHQEFRGVKQTVITRGRIARGE